jgi:hypothetical protein
MFEVLGLFGMLGGAILAFASGIAWGNDRREARVEAVLPVHALVLVWTANPHFMLVVGARLVFVASLAEALQITFPLEYVMPVQYEYAPKVVAPLLPSPEFVMVQEPPVKSAILTNTSVVMVEVLVRVN